MREVDNPAILAWAAMNGRILLTHDRATMQNFADDRLIAGEPMAGMFVVNDQMPIQQAIDELLLLINFSEQEESQGAVPYLPL